VTGIGDTGASSACPPDGVSIGYGRALDGRSAKLDANPKVQKLVIIGPNLATAGRAEAMNCSETDDAIYVPWRFYR
jgi:hypothetical protein